MTPSNERLRHSITGSIRATQISSVSLFVFVEGKTDRYFYDKLCSSVCVERGVSYEIKMAQELPDGESGKTALIKYHSDLKNRLSLMHRFKGKTTICLFYVDKDVDDLLRLRKPSKHLVYTQFYHFENYIFREGNLAEGLASAASVELQLCKRAISDLSQWRYEVANKWRDWVKICLLIKKLKIIGEPNYSKESPINPDVTGTVDASLLQACLERLKNKSGLTANQFHAAYKIVSKMVDDIYNRGAYDLVFKGRWYAKFLEIEMKSISYQRPYQQNGLAERLTSTIASTLDFSGLWADYLKKPLIDLLERL